MNSLAKFTAMLTVAAAATACTADLGGRRPGRATAVFEPGVEIPSEHYRIDGLQCADRIGEAVVDGETVEELQWLVSGTLVNVLDGPSPNYQLDISATLSDGSTFERDGTAFPALPAGASNDFSILVAGQGMFDDPTLTVVDCDIVVLDSILNYGS